MRRSVVTIGIIVITFAASLPALAKSARCFSTSAGAYACDFRFLSERYGFPPGSFTAISPANGTVQLIVSEPGVAEIYYLNDETGQAFRGGTFHRMEEDLACWYNGDLDEKFCAY